jgi:hypothetical protein
MKDTGSSFLIFWQEWSMANFSFRIALFLIGAPGFQALPVLAFGQTAPSAGCDRVPREDASPALCVPPTSEMLASPAPVSIIELKIPSGTPLRIALDERVRIKTPGQPVRGKVVETVYAFDQAVIPAGSVVTGHVAQIEAVPKSKRIQAYLNGNLTPPHGYRLDFDSVALPGGETRKLVTTVSAGTGEVVHLVASDNPKKKNSASSKVGEAKQEAQAKVHDTIEEIKAPGKMHRLRQLILAQSPYRRQYLEPGTRFAAVLNEPLDFGTTTRTKEQLSQLGQAPASDSLLHARLAQEVSSATAARGAPVTAVLTEPLYSADRHLLLPADSRIEGEVIQAKAAGKLHHNGDLRVIFNRIATPEGALQPTQGSLEGVEADRAAGLKLDDEGGAHATDSKTRYLSTGLALLMAAAASRPDVEHGTTDAAGDPSVRAGAGVSGYGFSGSLITLAARSQPVSIGFAAYGAGFSVYHNFLSRGKDVVFAKDTAMEIGIGARHSASPRPH